MASFTLRNCIPSLFNGDMPGTPIGREIVREIERIRPSISITKKNTIRKGAKSEFVNQSLNVFYLCMWFRLVLSFLRLTQLPMLINQKETHHTVIAYRRLGAKERDWELSYCLQSWYDIRARERRMRFFLLYLCSQSLTCHMPYPFFLVMR